MFSTFSPFRLSIQLWRFSMFWQNTFKIVCCRIAVWWKGLTLSHLQMHSENIMAKREIAHFATMFSIWLKNKYFFYRDYQYFLFKMFKVIRCIFVICGKVLKMQWQNTRSSSFIDLCQKIHLELYYVKTMRMCRFTCVITVCGCFENI